jgi:hypothetical protein
MRRPNPARWLWYAYGGRLPDRYREWVRYDNTARTWLLRHVLRVVAMALPVAVVAFVLLRLFTPVPALMIVGVFVMGLLVTFFFTIGMARDFAKARLAKHGLTGEPPPSHFVPEDAGEHRQS